MSDEKQDKWEMPAPVFRSSTGSLPKSLEDTISHSFMPNAETIEIDEDDDILSIMAAPAKGQEAEISEVPDGEKILEIGSDNAVAAEAHRNGDDGHKPVSVTAIDSAEDATSRSGETKSNLVVYFVVALIVVGIIAAVIYNQP